MALSLYEAFVPSCQQILTGLLGLIDKAEAFSAENGVPEAEFMDLRLAENMWTLPWHIRSCYVHSAFVIGLLPSGEFSPDFTVIPDSWAAMRSEIAKTQEKLAQVTEAELEAVADKEVAFVLGGKTLMTFTGQNFLLSFSQPNFYFHATTFYDLLRMKGVPLGKRDFIGPVRASSFNID